MTAFEEIQAAQQVKLTTEKGKPVSIELLPPLSAQEIDDQQTKVGLPLPEELRTFLSFCSGIDINPLQGQIEGIDLRGDPGFGMDDLFPHAYPIAGDGCGNEWILDITPGTSQVAPVYYACHDAPVILYQSPDLTSFFREVFRLWQPPHKSLIDKVQNDQVFDVWSKNPGVITQTTAAASPDPIVRTFASSLSEQFEIIDLRQAAPGMGFSWGRYGHDSPLRRHGHEPIFAYENKPRKGLFARLFGK